MKDFIKTTVLVLIFVLIFVIVFIVLGHLKHEVELLSRNELSINDPTVRLLYNRFKDKTELRQAHLINTEISSDQIIKFVFDNIEQDDYTRKTYEAEKITCQVTKTIDFTTSTGSCKVAIVDNEMIMKYQKKYFNTETELVFEDMKYHGLNCKNSGKRYYCLIGNYQDTLLGYSYLDGVYEEKDKILLYEYYLQIDPSDNDRCLEYFDQDYCANYSKTSRPYIDDSIIERDGVLYAHIFKKSDDGYYLEESYVVGDI